MELWELIARESIRDLVARYNANGDAGRFDPMLELFTEDAVMQVPPNQIYRGRDEIRSFFTTVASRTGSHAAARGRYLRHFTATHQIDVLDPSAARGRLYYAVLTDQGLDHWGRYIDEYRALGEHWLFQQRRVTVDGRASEQGH